MSGTDLPAILIVHNRYRERGGEDVVFENESALLATRYRVIRHEVDNRNMMPGLGPALAAWRLAWSGPSRRKVSRLLREHRPVVAHFHNTFPLITPSAFEACREAGVPVVLTLHNFRIWCAAGTFFREGRICEECVPQGPRHAVQFGCYRGSRLGTAAVARAQERWNRTGTWTRNVDRYIALTQFSKDKAVALGLPPEKVVVKPNFARDPGVVRKLPGESALFIGRLAPEKGADIAVRTFARTGWRLDVIGDGPAGDSLRELAAPSPGIRFHGRQPAEFVRSRLAACAFLVVPSRWYEMFPMVVVEAMASGVPVIASRVGGLGEIVRDGESGVLFEPGNEPELESQCALLFRDADLNSRLGLGARRQFEREYTEATNLDTLSGIYDALKRRSPDR